MTEETPLNRLAREIHETAVEKGWFDHLRHTLEVHALIHSEIGEATECFRNGDPLVHIVNGKPEGEAVELVDAIIRILDWLAHLGVDVDQIMTLKTAYNRTRAHRHGGKKA